jgi:hypothetical protein
VTVLSGTWNPAASGVGERNEDLGVYVHNVEVWREGWPFEVRDAQRIAPLPGTPHLNFWWANDDATRHHLTDLWAWYAKVAGLGQPLTGWWIGGYSAVAAAILATGLVLGWRSLPAGLFRTTSRRKRRRLRVKAPRVVEPHEQAA